MAAARSISQAQADLVAGVELGVAAILKLGENVRVADAVARMGPLMTRAAQPSRAGASLAGAT
jgi:hypothetical protein